jgi:lipopolysaccharide/colanic/teichoic acid biosynthesis glycosyltransferase/glycosyltransferase involved in cell wall biosynthesis
MKILVIHQYYLMPGHSGGSRFNELARLWSQAGHEVTVIAGTVDYISGKKPEKYRGRWLTREKDGLVTVWRCHVPGTYAKSYLGRAWAFFGFTLSAATAALLERGADVVIATSPPLVTPLPGFIASRLRARPGKLVFEIRDLWPESAITTGVVRKGSWLARGLFALEKWACSAADTINVLTPAFRDDLVRRGLASERKIAFVPNGADVQLFSPGPRDNAVRAEQGWGDRFVVMYSGAHGRANAVGQLLDAAARLSDRKDILITCVGDGPERAGLAKQAEARGLENVQFAGPQPKERMPDFVNACDVGAAVLQDNPTFRTVYPNKVFDYMACAKPTLLAIDGVARRLVCDEAKAGVFVQPEHPEALAEAIRHLADDKALCAALGARGRRWVLDHATREALARRYLEVMAEGPPAGLLQRGLPGLAKAALDRGAAAAGLAASAPVLLPAMAAVRLTMGAPALFVQERPGRDGRPFRLFKLRTMRDGRGPDGSALSDAERLTPLGRFLRSTSLDELPQLWNVVRGDLSLVGPRPLLMQYLERYSPEQARRHEVRPGITGWAQVNGRNALSWEEKFALDVWYVDHWSLWLDAKILAKTLAQVVRRAGISRDGYATMPEFMGTGQSEGAGAREATRVQTAA